jgi:hypothetical protein
MQQLLTKIWSDSSIRRGVASVYRIIVKYDYQYIDLKYCNPNKFDLIYLNHAYQIVPNKHARTRRHPTVVIDLSRSEEDIFRGFNDTTRNEIRRAIREGVSHEITAQPTLDHINEFLAASQDLMKLKGIPVADFSVLKIHQAHGELIISRTKNSVNEVQSYHVYIRRGSVALLINSLTIRANKSQADRSFASRANRLNHWEDAKFLKLSGVELLDIGGWASSGKGLMDLAAYKKGFGGRVISAYFQLIPMSLVGRVIMEVRNLRC